MTASGGADRHAQLAAFYRTHQHRLLKRVHFSAQHIDDTIAEDACAFAWLTLVRRTDIALTDRGYAWLAAVAVHEAWRLAVVTREHLAGSLTRRTEDLNEFLEREDHAADPFELLIAAELHRARVGAFSCLEARERRELLLHAGGYRYHEIATLTDSTYTAVNRRIADGRARLRRIWGANSTATGL